MLPNAVAALHVKKVTSIRTIAGSINQDEVVRGIFER